MALNHEVERKSMLFVKTKPITNPIGQFHCNRQLILSTRMVMTENIENINDLHITTFFFLYIAVKKGFFLLFHFTKDHCKL